MNEDSFCEVAVELGLVTDEQVARALEVQRALARPQRIGKILVASRLLTPSQVDAVLAEQGERRGVPPALDAPQAPPPPPFGVLAVREALATADQVEECLAAQRALAAQGQYVRLGELLVRRAYLARRHLIALLRLQGREHALLPGEADFPAPRTRETLARIQELAASGCLDECVALLRELDEDPAQARLAERVVRRAFLQRAAARAAREGLEVRTCDLCETASAVDPRGARCARCSAPLLP